MVAFDIILSLVADLNSKFRRSPNLYLNVINIIIFILLEISRISVRPSNSVRNLYNLNGKKSFARFARCASSEVKES